MPPKVGHKAAEGQTITLSCTVFGSPKPIVIWHKGLEQLTGGRYKVMDHGDLRIMVGQSDDLYNSVHQCDPDVYNNRNMNIATYHRLGSDLLTCQWKTSKQAL